MVIEARTDQVNHPYFIPVDIVERSRCTRVMDTPTSPYKTRVPQVATRDEKEPRTSIIDLKISNEALGLLDSWERG